MKKILCILLFTFIVNTINAQLINNRVNIYFGYSFGGFSGQDMLNEDGYISPSLYSNYISLTGYSFKAIVKQNDHLSIGVDYDYQKANNWNNSNHSDFINSEVQLHTITPVIQMHNKFVEMGLFNKFKILFETGPSLGISNLKLQDSLFDIYSKDGNIQPILQVKDFCWGVKGTIGFDYAINQSLGLYINYAYNINWISSKLYNDDKIIRSYFNFGVALKLLKNKYYYY